MADASTCLEHLPLHIYGYNNERDVIVYMVIKDTQSEYGQLHNRFQESPFLSIYTENATKLIFTLKQGLQFFPSLSFRGSKMPELCKGEAKTWQTLCVFLNVNIPV